MRIVFRARWGDGEVEIESESATELVNTLAELQKKHPLELPPATTQKVEIGETGTMRESYPSIKSRAPTDAVIELLSTEWGRKPREPNEISKALESNGLLINKNVLGVTLRRSYKRGKIKRMPVGKRWGYYIDKTIL